MPELSEDAVLQDQPDLNSEAPSEAQSDEVLQAAELTEV